MRHLLTLAILASMTWSDTANAGENYAFLVAVADYDRKELKPLQFTRNDIIGFHKTLLDSGYQKSNIVLMHDDSASPVGRRFLPESVKIREELRLLLKDLETDDTIIVAFAGHGVQFKSDKHHYFCPVDAKLTDRTTLVSIDEIRQSLEACPARRKLLLVDACRNDPQSALGRSRASVDLESVTRPPLEAEPEGFVALFSCAPGEQSFEDPELKHGVFFFHVLQAFGGAAKDDDGNLTVEDLVAFTKKRTQSFTRTAFAVNQRPQLLGTFTGTWVLRKSTTTESPLSGAKDIRVQVAQTVEDLAKLIKTKGSRNVRVSRFIPSKGEWNVEVPTSPGVAQRWIAALKAEDLGQDERAPLGITGRYGPAIDDRTGRLCAQMDGELTDESSRVLARFTHKADGDLTLASLFGITTEFPPKGSAKDRSDTMIEALKSPRFRSDSSKISSRNGSPYAIEILRLSQGKYEPLPVIDRGGQAFVALDPK